MVRRGSELAIRHGLGCQPIGFPPECGAQTNGRARPRFFWQTVGLAWRVLGTHVLVHFQFGRLVLQDGGDVFSYLLLWLFTTAADLLFLRYVPLIVYGLFPTADPAQ